MKSKIDSVQLKMIKLVRLVVLLGAVVSFVSGVWIACSTKVLFSSRTCLALVMGASILVCIYIFSKELKENKIDGTRAIAYFLSLGRCIFFSLTLYGIMEKNIGLIVFFASFAIFFIFLPTWYIAAQNRLKTLDDDGTKE